MLPELIEEINKECPYNQGIFKEPYGIPNDIKELVVYCRYERGGMKGGNCWGDKPQYEQYDTPKDRMKVLDILLSKIKPNITYLQYKEIDSMIHINDKEHWEYYGNSSEERIEFILFSELENYLETL